MSTTVNTEYALELSPVPDGPDERVAASGTLSGGQQQVFAMGERMHAIHA